MTVGEMRELMRRRVVPEGLVPQNVIGLLIDDEEDAAPPELDAFTFLTRLRALGIGSADFLYLLEGCEAPQSAVDRVRANPAMNLQGLILTLESSGLTSDDYSRMLYTARQIWERTLTLRLEKSEMVLQGGEEIEDYSEPSFEEVMDELGRLNEADEHHDSVSSYEEFRAAFVTEEFASPAAAENISSAKEPEPVLTETNEIKAEETPETESTDEAPAADKYIEETAENKPNETVEKPIEETVENESAETIAETVEETTENKPKETVEKPVEETTENEPKETIIQPVEDAVPAEISETEAAPETAAEESAAVSEAVESVEENSAEYSEDTYESSEETPVYTETIEPAKPYNGETTMIIQIDQEMLKQNLELLAKAEEEAVRAEAARVAAEQAQQEARAAYAAAKEATGISDSAEDGEPLEETDDEPDSESVLPVKTGKQAPFVVSIPDEHTYHKGAIITAAVGAAVLAGTSVVVDVFAGDPHTKTIVYAEISNDIFDEIYRAYYDEKAGGDKAAAYVPDYQTLFGDLLVNSGGFGTFSDGEHVYSVTEETISVSVFKNGALTAADDLLPPDGTRFAAVFDDRGTLVAVFGGKRECGYMRISGGSALYTVRQDGFLTDFALEEDGVMLGSVYTPSFSRSFKAEDIEVFMPSVGVEKTVMPVENVILSKTEGYSYAVSARYSLINGETESVYAAVGDPVFASSDGRFVMSGEEKYLLIKTGETILTAEAESDSRVAFSKKGCAVGKNNTVNLLSEDFVLMSQIANLPPSSLPQGNMPEAMRFKGDTLLIYGDTGLCRAADCSDMENPVIIALKEVNGAANSENALVLSAGGQGAELSYYILENGGAKEKYKFTKPLSAEELSTLKFGGVDAIVLDGERCGASFSYFDGVSVISDYAVMSSGKLETSVKELFDDKTGFTLAFKSGGDIYALCGNGIADVSK